MATNQQLYPLKFEPILKDKVWGGNKLANILKKQASNSAGESWELSGVAGNVSVIANGSFKGKNLNWLLHEFGRDLLGEKVYEQYGGVFPLLFKFIDARKDLSVQLHPDDKLAKQRHDSFGKTEMWYILDTSENARLILGFKEPMTESSYQKILSEGKITTVLHSEAIEKGDAFFIAPGTVHAIGAGTLLAEIQQTSDITYRIYDWDRPDSDGKMRELHTEAALEAINFDAPDAKINYHDRSDEVVQLYTCNYFQTNKLKLTQPVYRRHDGNSFRVYMCVEGEASIVSNGTTTEIRTGETVLIPASLSEIDIKTKGATLLEVFIP